MPGRKLKLGVPEVAAIIEERHARERDARKKNRLLAVKLAARGEHTSAEVADLCGIARGYLFEWLKTVRTRGLEALLAWEKPGPKEGSQRGMSAEVAADFQARLAAGEFVTGVAATRRLKEEHGVERPYKTVWRRLKKAGGVLLAPRPSHSGKDPAAAGQFREGLAGKLEALELPAGSRVKLRMMDEARFGPHTELRRVRACKGRRRWCRTRSSIDGTISAARSV